jgi:hypothetical protein
LKKYLKLLKLFDEKKDLSNYKAGFQKNELSKNKKYQKLNDDDKSKLNQLFSEISASTEFKCENCNYTNPITETILLSN